MLRRVRHVADPGISSSRKFFISFFVAPRILAKTAVFRLRKSLKFGVRATAFHMRFFEGCGVETCKAGQTSRLSPMASGRGSCARTGGGAACGNPILRCTL
jgi:hypothetical protein